ncbi:hypothetical protein LV779_36975 [Streptomyces thinghirensis]|nr:hypothetical protein [Streptomyces thinghirensis]
MHAETSGVLPLRLRRRGRDARRGAPPPLAAPARTTARTRPAPRPVTRRTVAATPCSTGPQRTATARTTTDQGHRGVVDDGEYLEGPTSAGAQHHLRSGPPGRPGRRHRRQPAAGPGRRPGHRGEREGRALRADVRRLQHPDHHPPGRARLPAGRRPGTRRNHSATAPNPLR